MRRSILVDAKADLLVYGAGEAPLLEILRRLEAGETLRDLPGTCELRGEGDLPEDARRVPSFEEIRDEPDLLAELFVAVREEGRPDGRPLAQTHGARVVLQHPPPAPPSTEELDGWYDLPFRRAVHPDHEAAGIPALETVRWSIVTHRGCFADCSFCSIAVHQGRSVRSRSEDSIVAEAARLAESPGFRGTITDVGGPTANMYGLGCARLARGEPCLDRDCLTPDVCPALRVHRETEQYRRLLGRVRELPGVKHAFVGSGIRQDLLRRRDGELLPLHTDLLLHHVSGRMKLAPEHAADGTLRAMNKPPFRAYEAYEAAYRADCAARGRDQHLVEYFLVGHPGTTLSDAVELFERLLDRNHSPEQVQEFIPLPLTRSCVQYVTGRDPLTGEELYVPRSGRERRVQKALVRWKASENIPLVEEALTEAGRGDLLPRFRHLQRQAQRREKARDGGLDPCG